MKKVRTRMLPKGFSEIKEKVSKANAPEQGHLIF